MAAGQRLFVHLRSLWRWNLADRRTCFSFFFFFPLNKSHVLYNNIPAGKLQKKPHKTTHLFHRSSFENGVPELKNPIISHEQCRYNDSHTLWSTTAFCYIPHTHSWQQVHRLWLVNVKEHLWIQGGRFMTRSQTFAWLKKCPNPQTISETSTTPPSWNICNYLYNRKQ